MAQETHKNIRDWIAANVSENVAKSVHIVYGGSMNGENAKNFWRSLITTADLLAELRLLPTSSM
jgi:triosephosphate isomerase